MLPFVSQVTENKPKYRSIWISGGKMCQTISVSLRSKALVIGCSLSTFHRKKNHLQIPSQNQQRLTSLISKGLGLFVSPAFGFMSGKGAPSGTVIL